MGCEAEYDVAVVGAGAAGVMAATWAARAGARVLVVDGARTLGAKILVAGGGRCNVTHDVVDERAFAGATAPALRRVLRRFGVAETIAFFRDLGVTLKREETGKLFPTTDRARTVLDALLEGARRAGVEVRHPFRVEAVARGPAAFCLRDRTGTVIGARAVVLATGGRSLPRSGSDGGGYALAQSLGHTITPHVFPALVPLTLPKGHALCALSGLAATARLEVRTSRDRRLASIEGPVLLTHFGLSGPAVLDVSRHLLSARLADPQARLVACWLPGEGPEALELRLREAGPATCARVLAAALPERLARALCAIAGVEPETPGHRLARPGRRALVQAVHALDLPVTGDRGWNEAEVTAGGVPLGDLHLQTLESRACPGLYLCGEICDVDGRIGGYNFQWAWSSGYVAGSAAGGSAARG